MFRTRLAALFLTGGLTLVSGCQSSGSMQLGCGNGCNGNGIGGGLFSNLRGNNNCDCCCASTMVGPVSSHVMASPDTVYGQPTIVTPVTNTVPGAGPMVSPPRVVPVPQAPAVPFNPMP